MCFPESIHPHTWMKSCSQYIMNKLLTHGSESVTWPCRGRPSFTSKNCLYKVTKPTPRMPQNRLTSRKASEFPIQDWQRVQVFYTQTKRGMTGTCGNKKRSTSCWNKCHSHHKSRFWTSSVPNKLPTNPTSPEPVPNDYLFWASASVSEVLVSEREIRWRDSRLPTCQVTNESVWLCSTRSQTGTRSWVWRALTLSVWLTAVSLALLSHT